MKRDDGRLQWAYKNSPVYTYFEDRPNDARGVGKGMDWYLDERGYAYLTQCRCGIVATAHQCADRESEESSGLRRNRYSRSDGSIWRSPVFMDYRCRDEPGPV